MIKTRLWLFLYTLTTWTILGLTLCLIPLLNMIKPKFAKWFRMRFFPTPLSYQPDLWLHAVSLGEIKIALALLDDREGRASDMLLTTSTQSGYRFLCDRMGKNNVRYLPWDLGFCYRRLFGRHQVPNLVVVETEIWPNLFGLVAGSGSKVVMVNARLSSRSLRLRNNALFRWTLRRTARIAARSDLDRNRYLQFGLPAEQVVVTGNIKYDFKPKHPEDATLTTWLSKPQPLLVFASISADEAPMLADQIKTLLAAPEQPRILWAPRHLRSLNNHLEALAPCGPKLRSRMEENDSSRLLVLDTFGELAGCYRDARASLIGGSFNERGGQNFLESLQAGTPALMGPATENFKREVAEALEEGTIIRLQRPQDVAGSMLGLLRNADELAAMSERARSYLARHTGAIARTTRVLLDLELIEEHLEDP